MIRWLAVSAMALCAQDTLPVPGNLKAEGIPQVPVELMEELAQYNSSRTASFADWHPLRREMLISTRFGDVPQAHRVTMPGGARTQLTFSPERVNPGRYHPVTGDSFFYSRDTGGGEFYQLYLFDLKTGRSTLLTDGKSRNTGARWSPSGKWIAYTSTRRNRKDGDIYVADPAAPATTRMAMQVDSPGWTVQDWSPNEEFLVVSRTTGAGQSALYRVHVRTGERKSLTPETGAAYGSAEYSHDGRSIYLLTNENSEFSYVASIDSGGGKLTRVTPESNWDVTGFEFSNDGRLLAYTSNEDGASILRIVDWNKRQPLKAPRLPYGVIGGGYRWNSDNRHLAFSMATAKSPADVYSIDAETGKLDRWTFSETGGIDAAEFSEPELIRWKSFDGLGITGYLYKPPARFAGPRPVLIQIHGGPEGQSRPGFLGRYNYLLNELGVAVIFPNVRGSTGYGRQFMHADNGKKREDSVKDIGALLDWIATRPELDSKRVMTAGGSYGGYMTLASMIHFNDRLRGGIDSVGISNWVTFLETTEAYRRDLRRMEYGDEREASMRDFLSTISPVHRANRITKPMMIVQGRNDPRVPYTESEQIVKAIRANGGPVWYLLADDEGHGFAKKRNADYDFAVRALFIKRHLLN